MDVITYLVIIFGFYCVILFFDSIFKSCSHYPYIEFLQKTGLKIKAFVIQWNVTIFNRLLLRWGSNYTRFFNFWFDLGMIVTLILLPIVVTLILVVTIQILFVGNSGSSQTLIIEPVIPGVNLPASELLYYSLTLIFCSVIHELGHALCAIKEGVHLINVGVIIIFILPIAYVNISTEKLFNLSPWKALRIICAGVWHNVVLAAFAFVLYLLVPYMFSPLFYLNSGVYISHIEPYSPLLGSQGFHKGDIITMINNCVVRDETSWGNCLIDARNLKPGFCVNTDVVHGLDESIPIKQLPSGFYDCCTPDRRDWLCFEYLDNSDGIAELPPHMCLPARKIIETFSDFCNIEGKMCPPNLHCIHPLLQNSTNLLKIKRIQKGDVLYIGYPSDILNTVHVSSFIPKVFFSTSWFPDFIMKMLRYITVISLGLAMVNVAPCIYMDGQHIFKFLTQILLGQHVTPNVSNIIYVSLVLCGTSFLMFHCLYTVWVKLSFSTD